MEIKFTFVNWCLCEKTKLTKEQNIMMVAESPGRISFLEQTHRLPSSMCAMSLALVASFQCGSNITVV